MRHYPERYWSDRDLPFASPVVSQNIYTYTSPIWAALHFWISRPEFAFRNDWPNFSDPSVGSDEALTEFGTVSSSADSQRFVCGMGGRNSCQKWFYWARYGQYLLLMSYFGPNTGLDIADFSKIAGEADRYVTSQLAR